VIPLEVKAEENLQAKSLKFFVSNNELPFGVRTSIVAARARWQTARVPCQI
jgi:hypothetical protein